LPQPPVTGSTEFHYTELITHFNMSIKLINKCGELATPLVNKLKFNGKSAAFAIELATVAKYPVGEMGGVCVVEIFRLVARRIQASAD